MGKLAEGMEGKGREERKRGKKQEKKGMRNGLREGQVSEEQKPKERGRENFELRKLVSGVGRIFLFSHELMTRL